MIGDISVVDAGVARLCSTWRVSGNRSDGRDVGSLPRKRSAEMTVSP